MRDKDAHLIFESYRNRVILNEVATALAVPAVEGLGYLISGIIGTAAGAVIIDKISSAYQTLAPGLAKKKADANIEKIKTLFQSDSSLKSQYNILNYIKDISKDSNLLKLESSQRNILDFYSSVQNNLEYTDENLVSLAKMALSQSKELANFIRASVSVEIEGTDALSKGKQAEIAKELMKMISGVKGGGGGEPPDDKDKKDKKDKKSAFDRFNELNMKNVLWLLAIVVAVSGVALIIAAPELVGAYATKKVIQTGKEAYKAAEQEITGKTPTQPKSPNTDSTEPKANKWVPETPVLPNTPSPEANAAPTPIPFKRK